MCRFEGVITFPGITYGKEISLGITLTKFYIHKNVGEKNYTNPDKRNDLSVRDNIRLRSRSSFAETEDVRRA